jgi:hypothetical protein
MLRRFLVVVGLVPLLVFGFSGSAQAINDHGQQCRDRYNGQQTRAIRLCVTVVSATQGPGWWIRFNGYAIAGFNKPDHTLFDGYFYSSKVGASCQGRLPNCQGPYLSTVNEPLTGWSITTVSFQPNEHYCNVWGLENATVYWMPTNADTYPGLNTSNVNTVPDCVA